MTVKFEVQYCHAIFSIDIRARNCLKGYHNASELCAKSQDDELEASLYKLLEVDLLTLCAGEEMSIHIY
jgi:hypothetical protein